MVSCSVGNDEINECTDPELDVNFPGADCIKNSDFHMFCHGKSEKYLLQSRVIAQMVHIV